MAKRHVTNEFMRVAVVGTSCSGKTTFARELSEVVGAAHIELDALHWKANWEARSTAEFRSLVEDAVSCEGWVADGNYQAVRELVWSRATAVVWLNYPFWRVFSRALLRTLRRVLTREELYSGNRESLRQAFFSRDSILLWVITSHWGRNREYRRLKEMGPDYPGLRVLELRTPSQTSRLLAQLRAAS
jgi:adenylate kinase family enzyme